MDRSHRQQTPSPHARPPPHGQVSSPADSPLPTLALPRMDKSHRQQTPSRSIPEGGSPHARPSPHGQPSSPADSPPRARALPRMGQISSPADSPLPRMPSPAWTGLIATRLPSPLAPRPPSPAWTRSHRQQTPSPHTRPPSHGQVSPPADSLSPRPPSPAWTSLIARSPPNPTSDILFAHQIFIVVFGGGAEGGGGWIGHSLALKADTPRTAAESYFLYIRDCDCIPAHKVFIASVRICII